MGRNKDLFLLNLSLVFISTSGVLGRYITIDSTVATFWRCVVAIILIYLFCRFRKISLQFHNSKNRNLTYISAVLLALHWVSYFYALDYSNVAIALLTLYTFPAITAILEPLMSKEKYHWKELLLAVITLLGIYVITPEFSFENNYTIAILLGLVSSFTYALRNIFIRTPAKSHHGSALMFHQLVIVILLLAPFLFFLDTTGSIDQWKGLVLLGLITTAIGHSLFVASLKNLSATTASILSTIVPVYALLWAYLFLGEVPAMQTLYGGAIIMSTVLLKIWWDIQDSKKDRQTIKN